MAPPGDFFEEQRGSALPETVSKLSSATEASNRSRRSSWMRVGKPWKTAPRPLSKAAASNLTGGRGLTLRKPGDELEGMAVLRVREELVGGRNERG